MKCTWHSSIAGMKANAFPCPPRLVSSHWFLARHLLTPAKVQMQFKCCVGTHFCRRTWHGVVNSPRQWMSSQVVYSNSETYFLFQLTSRLLVKLNNRDWRAFWRPSACFRPSISEWTRQANDKHGCSHAHGGKKKTLQLFHLKWHLLSTPLLQEIKFLNGPQLWQQNKGVWWLRVDFNKASFSTQVRRIWEMNVIISRSWKVSELNIKPRKSMENKLSNDRILYI